MTGHTMADIELEALDKEHKRHRNTKLDRNKLKKSQPWQDKIRGQIEDQIIDHSMPRYHIRDQLRDDITDHTRDQIRAHITD